jgi:hypothetical protein
MPEKESKAHWVSREVERFATPIITAVVISLIYFGVDFLVTEPELATREVRIEQNERLIVGLAENVVVLTKSNRAQTASINSLSSDRTAGIEKSSLIELERLETKNRGVPMDDWDVTDRRLYTLAESQLSKAIARSGGTP